MKLINLIEEDFTNYRKPGMFLGFPICSGKCNKDAGKIVCQNAELYNAKLIDISIDELLKRYYNNKISRSLIFGGLEPFDCFDNMTGIIDAFHNCKNYIPHTVKFLGNGGINDIDCLDIVIYTGYYPWEIEYQLNELSQYDPYQNILIKFGRYIPGHKPHLDKNLGVKLASDNQFSLWLSQLV